MKSTMEEMMVEIVEEKGLPEITINREKHDELIAFTCMAASPCGQYLALGRSDGTIWLWRPPSVSSKNTSSSTSFGSTLIRLYASAPSGWTVWYAHSGPVLSLAWVDLSHPGPREAPEAARAPVRAPDQEPAVDAPAAGDASLRALRREVGQWTASENKREHNYVSELAFFSDKARAAPAPRPLLTPSLDSPLPSPAPTPAPGAAPTHAHARARPGSSRARNYLLCSGGSDRLIRSWRSDHTAPRLVQVLPGHTASVLSLAAHRGRLVSTSGDGALAVWAPRPGRLPLVDQWLMPIHIMRARGAVPLCARFTGGGHGGALIVSDHRGALSTFVPLTRRILRPRPRVTIHLVKRARISAISRTPFPGAPDAIFAEPSPGTDSPSASASPQTDSADPLARHRAALGSPAPAPVSAPARLLAPLARALQSHSHDHDRAADRPTLPPRLIPEDASPAIAVAGEGPGSASAGGEVVAEESVSRVEFALAHAPVSMHSKPIPVFYLFASQRVLVTLALDGTATVSDTTSGAVALTITNPHAAPFTAAAWLRTAGILLLGDARGFLHAWDVVAESCLASIHVTQLRANSLFHPAHAAGPLATAKLFETAQPAPMSRGSFPCTPVVSLFANDPFLAVLTPLALRSTRVSVGPRPLVLQGHADRVHQLCPTGSRAVVSAGGDGAIRWWSADGQCQALAESDVTSRALDRADRHQRGPAALADAPGRPTVSECLCVCSLGGGVVASGHEDGAVLVWPAEQGGSARVTRWRLHSDSVTAITGLRGAGAAYGKGLCTMVASGGYGGLLCVWGVSGGGRDDGVRAGSAGGAVTGRALMCVETGSDILAICPLPQLRASTRGDATHAALGHTLSQPPSAAVEAVESCVATGHADGVVRVWDLEARRMLVEIHVDTAAVQLAHPTAAARAKDCAVTRLAADNDCLLAGTDSGLVAVLAAEPGLLVDVFAEHAGPVTALLLVPHNGVVVSADDTGLVLAWSYAERAVLWRHRMPVPVTALLLRGNALWTGLGHGPIVCLPLPEELLAVALDALPLGDDSAAAEDSTMAAAQSQLMGTS